MKAAQIETYGEPEVIEINETSSSLRVKDGQILVETLAASINIIDWKIRNGYLQKMVPLPFPITLGGDFTGKVVTVGSNVTGFTVGDDVYGQAGVLYGGSGSIAEMLLANAANTAIKPKSVSYVEASALPLAGASALQAIEEHIGLKDGQKILIHGGAGGIGHIAVQIAKSIGAHVATTVSTKDIEFVKDLGADEIIDYRSQKFEELLKDFDAVFDTVGGETAEKSFQVLKKGGIIVSMNGQPNPELAQKLGIASIGQKTKTDTTQLNKLTSLVDSGKVKVHVNKIFLFEQTREAFVYQEKNHPQGKVVIKIKS